MPDFIYGTSSFERKRGDFPSLPVLNMFAEAVPTEPGVALQSRPGIETADISMGAGPVRGLFTADGVLTNGLFGVSGSAFYKGSTEVGTVVGTGPVSFGAYQDFLFVNAGGPIYGYDNTDYTTIAFPDDADVAKVVVAASRLVAVRKDTGVFYWSEPLGLTIDSLSFATAENSPDTLKDALYLGDRLILFGAETIEFWPATTDANAPFAPLPGATIPIGIKGTGMATNFNRSFAWVTNYNEICVGGPDNIITEPELQVKIEESANVSLWVFYVDNNEYLALRIDGETWAYGARSGVWCKLSSYGEDNWVCHFYDNGYFGSATSGTLNRWSEDYNDFGNTIERRFRAWLSLTADSVFASNIVLRANPGTTPFLNGEYADPKVELRTSRDGGHTWDPWKSRSLGKQGKHRAKTFWSSMGQFGFPGILAEVRVTDPVDFRASGLGLNEPFGAR